MAKETPMSIPPPAPPSQADVRGVLGALWRRKWIFLVIVVVLPAAVYAMSKQATKEYESSVLLQVQAQAVDTSLFATADTTPPDQSLNAAARLIQTTAVAEEAAKRIRPRPAQPRSLLGQIGVAPDLESGFITITATDPDPQRAADIANAFAGAVVATRAQRARRLIDATIGQIKRNILRLDPSDRDGRRGLSQQLQRLRALRAAQGNNAQVVEPAVASAAPVSPHPRRSAVLAFLIALLIAAGAVFLLERMDRRLREPLDLEGLTGAPLLGVVPTQAFGSKDTSPEAREAFATLASSLTYFNIERPLDSVLITSPLKGDGKTTVATKLALAVARTGKDVVIVDCDLRHPQVDVRLGSSAKRGLGDVLVGEARLDDVMGVREVAGGRLRVVPAGPPPPNPAKLLTSEQMRSLLTDLERDSDLVIIDSPPALIVSDAMPLVERVSGIVVVARMSTTTRDAMQRLVSVVSTAGGKLLGVVATGAKGSGLYGYGTYAGYDEPMATTAGPASSNGAPSKPRSLLRRG
jgi:capsular exopolysaccharide synthesis family protein